ncbi:MAG: hypothetical protein HYR63_21020 [Proteobacteria bacterium]|nr:hypothetical protein [Pseudomonadota bacterium]MBI3498689.1 hypothetical protein [Pseudomonadota bacterium]
MVGPINPTAQPSIPPELSKATSKTQSDSTKSSSTSTPTDTVNVPSAGLGSDGEVLSSLDDARATAKAASNQLAGQSLNIANARTQGLSALFRAA